MKKAQILINKTSLSSRLSILKLSKIFIHEFWHHYVKPKYNEKTKLCYMDIDSFIIYIKADNIYKDIAGNVETKFDTQIMYYIDH